jgi:hypothetical protein
MLVNTCTCTMGQHWHMQLNLHGARQKGAEYINRSPDCGLHGMLLGASCSSASIAVAADFAFAPIRAPEPSSSGTIFGAGSASTPYQPTGTASHAGGVSPAMGLLAGASTTGGAAGTPSLGGASTASEYTV